jgi:hypothetical protein
VDKDARKRRLKNLEQNLLCKVKKKTTPSAVLF